MRNFTTIALKKDTYKLLDEGVRQTYESEHPDDKRAKDLDFLSERAYQYYINH